MCFMIFLNLSSAAQPNLHERCRSACHVLINAAGPADPHIFAEGCAVACVEMIQSGCISSTGGPGFKQQVIFKGSGLGRYKFVTLR
jgi:hypothetical protein